MSGIKENEMPYSEKLLDHYDNPRNVGILDKDDDNVGTGMVGAPACSLATEMLKGKTLDQAANIKNTDLAQELALPPVKIHCSVLAEDAIKAAVNDLRKKRAEK
jgi:nitrogen fixation NifU-like protein